jgi:hypothetical protein
MDCSRERSGQASVALGRVRGVIACGACLLAVFVAEARAEVKLTNAAGGPYTSGGQYAVGATGPLAAAALDQCVTSVEQTERSATFSGEMTAIPGTARMAIRIDIEERLPAEEGFHVVNAAGLGVWRYSEAKVKVYKYLKQVTNLSSPAVYRASVRFRWLSGRGRVLRRSERATARSVQPAAPRGRSPAGAEPSAPSVGSAASTPA